MVHNVWPYLGGLGRLIEVPFTASEAVSTQDRYAVKATMEGRRRAQVRPASPRSWNVDVKGARPNEVAALSDFVTGAWGAGPWHWVSVQAQRGNLLTPREAALLDRRSSPGWVEGGPVVGTDGTLAPRSVLSARTSSWASLFTGVPVIPGVPVTWSADIAGDGAAAPALASSFADASGSPIGSGVTEPAPSAVGLQRVSQTRVPPEGAVSISVGIFWTARRVTRPQVTWTAGPVPYSAGHGCRSAIVDGWSEDLIVANSFGNYSNAGFSVVEVG